MSRKNSERKKKRVFGSPLSEPSFTVRLPLSAFLSASTSNPCLLLARLKQANQVPINWSHFDGGDEESLSLYKLIQPTGAISLLVTISKQLFWKVYIGESDLRPNCELLQSCYQTVSSVLCVPMYILSL